MKLKLGFSTCPNDTYIFDAMVHHKIDTEGLKFDLVLADVEQLNKQAFKGELDITKLSYHTYALVSDKYILLDSGSALGNNNGPLLISKEKIFEDDIDHLSIAIPGKNTTANLLLEIAYPNAKNKKEYLFSDIEDAILSDEVDAGLIIHENRFTYKAKGLRKVVDLGEYWELRMKLPIPLGGIAVNRRLSSAIQHKLNRVMRRSVEFAMANPLAPLKFVRKYAQDMNENVMYQHIKLYVNEYTVNLGDDGKRAISTLYNEASKLKILNPIELGIFLEDQNNNDSISEELDAEL